MRHLLLLRKLPPLLLLPLVPLQLLLPGRLRRCWARPQALRLLQLPGLWQCQGQPQVMLVVGLPLPPAGSRAAHAR